ncbi:hypothetical protein LTR66_017193, partial [Elasticomyces elasticus]
MDEPQRQMQRYGPSAEQHRDVEHQFAHLKVSGGTNHFGDNYYTANVQSAGEQSNHRERLLNSLRYDHMNARLNDIEEACKGTFEWLLKDDETEAWSKRHFNKRIASFPQWLESDGHEVYVIEGKPGSGKSTLMKFFHQQLVERSSTSDSISKRCVLSHFFWLGGSVMQKPLKGMLLNLAFQLLYVVDARRLEDRALLPRQPKMQHTDWSNKELGKFIIDTMKTIPQELHVLIDALDEFDPEVDKVNELATFLKLLSQQQNVKLCVSSRPLAWVDKNFDTKWRLRLQDANHEDIRALAEVTLNELADAHELVLTRALRRTILDEVLEKADGVFLWVTYALKNVSLGLEAFDSAGTLLARISKLPS